MAAAPKQVVTVDGRELSLSNLDKVLYPAAGTTKGEVIEYYARIAPVMLPHLAGRGLTFKRFPNGVERDGLLREALRQAPPGLGADRGRAGRPQRADPVLRDRRARGR